MLENLRSNSFTPAFQQAVQDLASRPFDEITTNAFINTWGNCVLDLATLGATVYKNYFFEEGSSRSLIQDTIAKSTFREIKQFTLDENNNDDKSEKSDVNGYKRKTTSTSVKRLGEFSTNFLGASGGGGAYEDKCSIGNAILPQVCVYTYILFPDFACSVLPHTNAHPPITGGRI